MVLDEKLWDCQTYYISSWGGGTWMHDLVSWHSIQEMLRYFTQKHKCERHGGAKRKSQGTTTVSRIHECLYKMSWQSIETNVEIFQSGPKERHTLASLVPRPSQEHTASHTIWCIYRSASWKAWCLISPLSFSSGGEGSCLSSCSGENDLSASGLKRTGWAPQRQRTTTSGCQCRWYTCKHWQSV